MATFQTGQDEKGRRSYDIAGEYADDKVDQLLDALRADKLTARVELHHRRLGSGRYVKLFIPVSEGREEKVDTVVSRLVGQYLIPGTA